MATFNPWQQALYGLSSGLMAAGSPGGWGNFGAGVGQGIGQFQNNQARLIRDKMLQQQFDRDEARYQAEQADKDATAKRMEALRGNIGGLLSTYDDNDPSNDAFGPMDKSRLSLARLQLENDPQGLLTTMGDWTKPQDKPKPIEIAGRLVDPNDPTKVLADYSEAEAALRRAGAVNNSTTIKLPEVESEFAKTVGKTDGEQASAITPAADKARMGLDQISALEHSVAQIQAAGGDTGKLAPLAAQMSAYAQAAGIDPASLGLPPNAGPYEQAIAIGNKLALANIGADQGGLPANNFTETDRKFVVEIAPQISNTPQGFAAKVDLAKRVAERNLDAETLWNSGKYEQTQAGFRQYKKDWAAYVKAHPLYSAEEMAQIKALTGGAPSGSTVIDGYTITPVQ